jgi:hypothetical protein
LDYINQLIEGEDECQQQQQPQPCQQQQQQQQQQQPCGNQAAAGFPSDFSQQQFSPQAGAFPSSFGGGGGGGCGSDLFAAAAAAFYANSGSFQNNSLGAFNFASLQQQCMPAAPQPQVDTSCFQSRRFASLFLLHNNKNTNIYLLSCTGFCPWDLSACLYPLVQNGCHDFGYLICDFGNLIFGYFFEILGIRKTNPHILTLT